MTVDFTIRYSDRVKILPKATLNDGSEVSDYAEAMVVDLVGVSGSYTTTIGNWVNFISPSDKGPAGYVSWSSLSAGALPDFAKTAGESWSGSVSGQVVTQIESQFNAPINETVPDWAG